MNILIDKETKWYHQYPKIIGTFGKKGEGVLPNTNVYQEKMMINKGHLKAYNSLIGYKDNNFISPTYLHILAMPAHLALLTDKNCPYPLMGAIHLSNQIKQYRSLQTDEPFSIMVAFGAQKAHDKGQAYEVITKIHVGEEKIWEESSTFLHKGKPGIGTAIDIIPEAKHPTFEEKWELSSNMGLQYARVSGDFNPIHLNIITAKIMGMNRPIIHGMYSKARALRYFCGTNRQEAIEIGTSFKVPISLPSSVRLRSESTKDKQILFDIMDNESIKPHLRGYISIL